MALDGIVLNKVVNELQVLENSKINKIYQVSNTELLFHLKTHRSKQLLLISAHSQYNRIHLTKQEYPIPQEPSNYVMLLRKHLERGTILSITQTNLDRVITIKVRNRNEIGDEVTFSLIIELMGKYANVVLVNAEGKIMDALKRIPPYENTKRIIQPGATFQYPEIQDKENPFLATTYNLDQSFVKQFLGFSPLLSTEVQYRLMQGEAFKEIINALHTSETIYIYPTKNDEYHLIPLLHLETTSINYPIMEAFDMLYFHKEEKDRIRQQTGDLFKYVRKEIKKNTQKLPKLEASLAEALDNEKWREYGDLLYSYQHQVTKGDTSIELPSFNDDTIITIPLDPRLDAKGNAQKYFKRYRKGKTGQQYLLEQIELTEKELAYFKVIEQHLELADFNDAQEIRDELTKYGYLKPKHQKSKKQKKTNNYNYLTINYQDDITIYVGKNNLQNDYLTFHLANKQYYWFHAKDYHGAHVIVSTDELDEKLIRLCAMLSAYYSQARASSSIPVDYTQVKNIKKIPRTKAGLVSISNYQTIYIDIDLEVLKQYLKNLG